MHVCARKHENNNFEGVHGIRPEAYDLEAYNSGYTAGDFWDPEEPIKFYILIWICKVINVTRSSVEESAAKTLKLR